MATLIAGTVSSESSALATLPARMAERSSGPAPSFRSLFERSDGFDVRSWRDECNAELEAMSQERRARESLPMESPRQQQPHRPRAVVPELPPLALKNLSPMGGAVSCAADSNVSELDLAAWRSELDVELRRGARRFHRANVTSGAQTARLAQTVGLTLSFALGASTSRTPRRTQRRAATLRIQKLPSLADQPKPGAETGASRVSPLELAAVLRDSHCNGVYRSELMERLVQRDAELFQQAKERRQRAAEVGKANRQDAANWRQRRLEAEASERSKQLPGPFDSSPNADDERGKGSFSGTHSSFFPPEGEDARQTSTGDVDGKNVPNSAGGGKSKIRARRFRHYLLLKLRQDREKIYRRLQDEETTIVQVVFASEEERSGVVGEPGLLRCLYEIGLRGITRGEMDAVEHAVATICRTGRNKICRSYTRSFAFSGAAGKKLLGQASSDEVVSSSPRHTSRRAVFVAPGGGDAVAATRASDDSSPGAASPTPAAASPTGSRRLAITVEMFMDLVIPLVRGAITNAKAAAHFADFNNLAEAVGEDNVTCKVFADFAAERGINLESVAVAFSVRDISEHHSANYEDVLLDYQTFHTILSELEEKQLRQQRAREREIRATIRLSDEHFKEFREDLSRFKDVFDAYAHAAASMAGHGATYYVAKSAAGDGRPGLQCSPDVAKVVLKRLGLRTALQGNWRPSRRSAIINLDDDDHMLPFADVLDLVAVARARAKASRRGGLRTDFPGEWPFEGADGAPVVSGGERITAPEALNLLKKQGLLPTPQDEQVATRELSKHGVGSVASISFDLFEDIAQRVDEEKARRDQDAIEKAATRYDMDKMQFSCCYLAFGCLSSVGSIHAEDVLNSHFVQSLGRREAIEEALLSATGRVMERVISLSMFIDVCAFVMKRSDQENGRGSDSPEHSTFDHSTFDHSTFDC